MKHKKDEPFVNLFPSRESSQRRKFVIGIGGAVAMAVTAAFVFWPTGPQRSVVSGAQAADVSDAQLRAELETYIFNPCIESAVPPEGLADLDDETVTEVIRMGFMSQVESGTENILSIVRNVRRQEDREVFYSTYRDACIRVMTAPYQ